jgi:HNH endonuclease
MYIESIVKSFCEFADMKGQIALDRSFNVGSIEKCRWDLIAMRYYIESIPVGMAVNCVVLIDIESCLENCVEGDEDWLYFKSWKDEGYSYIALDGNNRSVSICKYFAEESFGLNPSSSITIFVPGKGAQKFPLYRGGKYSQLPDAVREAMNRQKLDIKLVKQATRREISDFFIRVNSGKPLNDHEKLNAELTEVASFIRDFGFEYEWSFGSQILSENQIVRFSFHELIASFLSYYTHYEKPVTLNIGTFQKAYEQNSLEEKAIPGISKFLRNFLDIVVNDPDKQFENAGFGKFESMDWFIVYDHLIRNNIKIKDPEMLLSWFVDIRIKLRESKDHVYTNKQGSLKMYSELTTDDADKLVKRREILIQKLFESKLFDDGVLVEVDDKRLYSERQRYELWLKQDGVCPETGLEIPIHEIWDGTKWQADHIVEHADGGETTVENGQLIHITAHQKKTGNYNRKKVK